MPSFDIVSEFDRHEAQNAVDQANREVQGRFDFRGVDAGFELSDESVALHAEVDFQLKQMLDILRNKLIARSIDPRIMDVQDAELSGVKARQTVALKQGLEQKEAKDIVKRIKDSKLKVQAQIQGDKVRVTGKKRDDLQSVMALLRGDEGPDLALQFDNFRD
ncbi:MULTISPECIES: YajQ family cyclic di-GMP-binding protein [unclassified Halomonas]|uniref:Nucleotide-binding protein NFG57_14615 n=1 Tax=Halomonas sp. H10-59 TaxID=2950874 RepID=A0AAU7KQQ6_9GAMM|nr:MULTISPECIES: YajQ family cyclic di-GMP-binding protein [unclassified Halomonas]KJZ15543.1 nucleotide-binding protein [Halomonas sp. S2151]MBR9880709.1 YajQ family cyclic di-GMP-binding protein [Gammaproteobacteria bacterium]MBY6109860.1 YajQ family cyclic di-GMP-binding protein [Halomonas sp. DP1Y21-3]MCO7216157.1 YajQ family cyclic di-GMP-binding protein [Halomonas sp. OfavH-34-E]|tara:strand:+ start:43 stop:528 length:486 start_codon:yes stop_codon:yes gene_type:complete